VLGDGVALEQLERGPPVTVLGHEARLRRALSVRDPDGTRSRSWSGDRAVLEIVPT
jgi:hypothetical protein